MPFHLGRLAAPDQRDKQYPMSLAVKPKSESIFRFWRYWRSSPALDQGATSQCVGFSWTNWLRNAPLMTPAGTLTARLIYNNAQKVDEWEGENYEGTSVRAGAKATSDLGHISSYLWATTPEELSSWVLTKGPVVVGTNWYEGMFTPLPNGYVEITGQIVGGHAYLVTGYNKILKKYRCQNSWGSCWGRNGNFIIKADDLHRLVFEENGEACSAIEQKLGK